MMTFAEYVQSNWLNVVQIDGRWAILRDVAWTIAMMAKEGHRVRATGESRLLANDAVATFIEPQLGV